MTARRVLVPAAEPLGLAGEPPGAVRHALVPARRPLVPADGRLVPVRELLVPADELLVPVRDVLGPGNGIWQRETEPSFRVPATNPRKGEGHGFTSFACLEPVLARNAPSTFGISLLLFPGLR